MVLTLKVKVKVQKVKVQNLIISIPGKDETCLKIWKTLEQNYGFDFEGQGQGGQVPNLIISILAKDKIYPKLWTTLHQNYILDLEGQGQGPKFNHFYSRQRRNLSEILNDIASKL